VRTPLAMALFVWGHNNSQQLGLDVADKEVFEMVRPAAIPLWPLHFPEQI
jgi:hypothetical protein